MRYFKGKGDLTNLVKSPPPLAPTMETNDIIAIRAAMEDIADYGCEITVTFKPEIHQRYKSVTLTRMVFDLLTSLRTKPNTTLEVILIGEFSSTGMYHMHGVLYCNDTRLLNNLRRKLTQHIGRTEIKMIHNVCKYIDYILKGTPERIILHEEVISFIKQNFKTQDMPKSYNTQ